MGRIRRVGRWGLFVAICVSIPLLLPISGHASVAGPQIWTSSEVDCYGLSVTPNVSGNANFTGNYFMEAWAYAKRNGTEFYDGPPAATSGNVYAYATTTPGNHWADGYSANLLSNGNFLTSASTMDLRSDPAGLTVSGEGNAESTGHFTVTSNGFYKISFTYDYFASGSTNVPDVGLNPIYAGYLLTMNLWDGANHLAAVEKSGLFGGGAQPSFNVENFGNLFSWEGELLSGRTYDLKITARAFTEASQPVPIPGTLLLFGSGIVGLIGIGRKHVK